MARKRKNVKNLDGRDRRTPNYFPEETPFVLRVIMLGKTDLGEILIYDGRAKLIGTQRFKKNDTVRLELEFTCKDGFELVECVVEYKNEKN